MLQKICRSILVLCCTLLCFAALSATVSAAESETTVMAENISGRSLVEKQKGFPSVHQLFDKRTKEPNRFKKSAKLTLAHEAGIGSLYLVFDSEYGAYTVTDTETQQTHTAGTDGFLHEFLDLEAIFGKAPVRVDISFQNGEGKLNELYAFTSGQTPDFVQKWQQPKDGETDIVLFSTHGDDEQLFFAGMLPYYAVERECQVQVVYMTGHRNMSMRRSHEMLDGLWAVGIRNYPVFGEFGDYNTRSAGETYLRYNQKGITEKDILSFVVEQLRRFRPKVAVGHDLAGEYGHGMHMVYAENLCKAVEVSMNPDVFPELAEEYGVWDVPKTYLHLYPENPVVMNWDQPMESFDGMTPYEVTKELGFPCHDSQQTYYSWYFNGKKTAADITEYSPCEFGLYRTNVGEDAAKNDFLENVTTHAEDVILREEAARKEAEEAARRAEEEAIRESMEAQQETAPAATLPEEKGAMYGALPVFGAAAMLLMLTAAAVQFIVKKIK